MQTQKQIAEIRLKELGLGPIEAATSVGVPRDTVRDLLRGKKDAVRNEKVDALAKALRVLPAPLARNILVREGDEAPVEIPEVQYTGPVGAGNSIRDVADGSLDPSDRRAILPSSIDLSRTGISEIKGVSLGKQFEGWYVVHTNRGPFHPDLYNKLCVVETDDGDVLLKWIERPKGKRTGIVLKSGDGSTHAEGVGLAWVAEVIGLRPQ